MRAVSVLLALAPLTAACGYTQLTVTRRAPAEFDLPAGKVVAVAPLPGEGGAELSSDLTAALVSTGHFRVLERQHLDAALAELAFSSQHVADETAMSFGNMTGAGALVTGEITTAEYREDVTATRAECPGKDGKPVECVQHLRVATARLAAALKVLATETGEVLAARTLSAERSRRAQATDAEPPPFGARSELLAECRAEVVSAFSRAVAPHDRALSVTLRSDDDLPELETGNALAQAGNWAAAAAQYRLAVERAAALSPELQAMALLDLGVALGFTDAYADAVAALERSITLDPTHLAREALDRVRQLEADAARLARQVPGS